MKIRLLAGLLCVSIFTLASTLCAEPRQMTIPLADAKEVIDAQVNAQTFVYFGKELELSKLAGQEIAPLEKLINQIVKLAPEEKLATALENLTRRIAAGSVVAPKAMTLEALEAARSLLVTHNDQIASDAELKSLDSQLEFYKKAIENDVLTITVSSEAVSSDRAPRPPLDTGDAASTGDVGDQFFPTPANGITLPDDVNVVHNLTVGNDVTIGGNLVINGTVIFHDDVVLQPICPDPDIAIRFNTCTGTEIARIYTPSTVGGIVVSTNAGVTENFRVQADGNSQATGNLTVTGVTYANGGVDRSTAATLSLGTVNANAITIGGANVTGITSIDGLTTNLGNTTATTLNMGTTASTDINIGRAGTTTLDILGTTLNVTGTTTAVTGSTSARLDGLTVNVGNTTATDVNIGNGAATVDITGSTISHTGLTEITAGNEIQFFNPLDTFHTGIKAGALVADRTTLVLPLLNGAANDVLVNDGAANLSWNSVAGLGAFVQNGNSFGVPAVLGTNDDFSLSFETNNTTRLSIADSVGGGAITATPVIYANGGVDRSAAATLSLGTTNATAITIGGANVTGIASIDGLTTNLGNTTATTLNMGTTASTDINIGRAGTTTLDILGTTLNVTGTTTAVTGSTSARLDGLTVNVGNTTATDVNIGNGAATVDITGSTISHTGLTEITAGNEIQFFNPLDTFHTGIKAGALVADRTTLVLPLLNGAANDVLVNDGAANLSWGSIASVGAFVQNGNSFGVPAVLGTNDDFSLSFETNNTTRLSIANSVGAGAITATPVIYANGGVDRSAAATLSLGTTNATAITIGSNPTTTVTNINSDTSLPVYKRFIGNTGNPGAIMLYGYQDGIGNDLSFLSFNTYIDSAFVRHTNNTGYGTAEITMHGLAGNGTIIFATGLGLPAGTAPTAQMTIDVNGTVDLTTGLITTGSTRYIHKTGTNNFFAGVSAGVTGATAAGLRNTGIGVNALTALTSDGATTGLDNTAIGYNAGAAITTAKELTAVGSGALDANTVGNQNTAVGFNALTNHASGNGNTALGHSALAASDLGTGNTALGFDALQSANSATSLFNTAVGAGAGSAHTTGSYNTMLGYNTNPSITGSRNIIIGESSGSGYPGAESSNIIINNAGVAAESNTIRIGTPGAGVGQQNRCFIAGIRGITTGVADAIAVLIDSTGQLGTISSSRRYKENIQPLDSQDRFMQLNPVTFNYKSDATHHTQYGFIAEDVEAVYPELTVYNQDGQVETVAYHLMYAILTKEIQTALTRIQALEAKLAALGQ